jgi:septal ring-binding cell division protein DamX
VLAAAAEGTSRYAEALFWRARLGRTAAGAERDYRQIVVEYALSARAPEALFRLAQLEMTRNDRRSARMHLERLQREHPGSDMSTRGSALLAQLAFNDGDEVVGCTAVAAARDGLKPSDVELRNQLDYYGPRCANVAARIAAGDSTATTPAAAGPPPNPAGDERPSGSGASRPTREFSVQVAAYDTRAEADAHAKRLSGRNLAARVVGDRAPYRVRIGRFATRERADNVRRQIGNRAIVVEAEPQ